MSAKKGERGRVLLRLPVDLLARVDAHAAASGVDRSSALVELIGRGLGDGATSSPTASTQRPGRSAAKSRASAPVQAAASALASVDRSARRRAVVGFDPLTGAPIYREA